MANANWAFLLHLAQDWMQAFLANNFTMAQ